MINELIIPSYICDEYILAKITSFLCVCTCRLVF